MRRSLFSVAVLLAALSGCGGPAQIGADKETYRAVDALYTAVSLRDLQPLGRCEGTLRDLRAAGKLPDEAATALEAIIATAREGQWERAQSRLGDFMRGQTR